MLDPVTAKLILTALPILKTAIFKVGDMVIDLTTNETMTAEEMIAALEQSKNNWEDFKFESPDKT